MAVKEVLGKGVVAASIGSLVFAPQAGAIAAVTPAVPLLPALGFNLLLAAALATAWLRVLRTLSDTPGQGGIPLSMTLAHLPLTLLWWPVVSGRPGGWPRLWVPVAALAVACLMAAATRRLHRLWRHAAGLAAMTGVAAVAAGPLAARPMDGSFSVGLAALWGVVLMVSLAGWGAGLARVLLPAGELDCGQELALGMAVAVAAGGMLNLVWAVSHATILLFVGTGIMFWFTSGTGSRLPVAGRPESSRRVVADPVAIVLAVVVAGLLGLQYAGAIAGTVDTVVATPPFDLHDDHQAYLVFPGKMLQLGSLGPEPFETRRMLSMGGQSFLHTLVLVALPLRTLHLLDGGIALVALVLLVAGGARRRNLGRLSTLLVLLVVLANPHSLMRGNTTAVLSGVLLLFAWYRLLSENLLTDRPCLGNAVLVGVHAAGLCALKSTLIPAAVGMLAVSAGVTVVRSIDRRGQLREVAATLVVVVLLLLPWMVSIYLSSGTLLYPAFGAGFYSGGDPGPLTSLVADDGPFDTTVTTSMHGLGKCGALLAPLLPLIFVPWAGRRGAAAGVVAGALLTVVLLVLIGDPHLDRSLTRYAYPVATAGVLVMLLSCLADRRQGPDARATPAAVAAFLVGCSLLLVGWDVAEVYRRAIRGIEAAASGLPVVSENQRRAMAAMEQELPPCATVLETLPHPFLLDLSRQQVRLMSLPGLSSLPPGLPLSGSAEEVADYLRGHSIRYLAYGGHRSVRDLLTVTQANIELSYPHSRTRWLMLRSHQRFREVVAELARARKLEYCDESIVLIDLARPVGRSPARRCPGQAGRNSGREGGSALPLLPGEQEHDPDAQALHR